MAVADITGRRFGALVALEFSPGPKKYDYRWLCQCDCGSTKVVGTSHLRSGATVSCGCRLTKRDGATSDPLFPVWSNMMGRCYDPSNKAYPDYGGRGIAVDPPWANSPRQFIQDMSPRPTGMTLDRKCNDGHYSKDNCRWASRIEQANNKRNVPLIEHQGRKLSVAQWAREAGIPAETLRSRLIAGRPMDRALLDPLHSKRL